MTTEIERFKNTINSRLEELKSITDEEFEEIKKGIKGHFDEEIESIVIAVIESKRNEFKNRN